jgi:hypothetical protein
MAQQCFFSAQGRRLTTESRKEPTRVGFMRLQLPTLSSEHAQLVRLHLAQPAATQLQMCLVTFLPVHKRKIKCAAPAVTMGLNSSLEISNLGLVIQIQCGCTNGGTNYHGDAHLCCSFLSEAFYSVLVVGPFF